MPRRSFDTATPLPQALLAAPKVPVALPDVPGGEANLLPLSALSGPLKVTFDKWNNTVEGGELTLFWGNDLVESKFWDADMPEDELFILVPVSFLVEGEPRLRYTVKTAQGVTTDSLTLSITIDTTPPLLNRIDPLIFPPEVINAGVTAQWLNGNGDWLKAQVPDYVTIRPGDVIRFYWGDDPKTWGVAGEKTVEPLDIGSPLMINISGITIRIHGDGSRFAGYEVIDRAGNVSRSATPVKLLVIAQSRILPWPTLQEATGTGQSVSLDPLKASQGVLVRVPTSAVINPSEEIKIVWSGVGRTGQYETSVADPPGSLDFPVPASAVPANFLKTVEVYYQLTAPSSGAISRSPNLHLAVKAVLPVERFSQISCDEAPGGNVLSLSSVPNGCHFSLDEWVFIAPDQKVSAWVEAVDQSDKDFTFEMVNERPVSPSEVSAGIRGISLPRDQLERMKVDESFTVYVTVRFDDAVAPTDFPKLIKTLVD